MPYGTFGVIVELDGVELPDESYCSYSPHCHFTVSAICSPTITQVEPISGPPGGVITIHGDIKTTKYGTNERDEEATLITRIYAGGQKCDLLEDSDVFYGIEYEEATRQGFMICKIIGTYIGNSNVSYLLREQYGRSVPNLNTLLLWSNGIAMFQHFTEIESLSQQQGSKAGETRVTIGGRHFDETDDTIKAFVGSVECVNVEYVSDTEIVCITPADASQGNTAGFTGNRGVYAYVDLGGTDASTIDLNTATPTHLDKMHWEGKDLGQHAVKIVGYFVPIFSGAYKFCVRSKSSATLYMSFSGSKEQVLSGSGDKCNNRESSEKSLTKGESYYFEIEYASDSPDSFVSLDARLLESRYNDGQTGYADNEQQTIRFSSSVLDEIQTISLSSEGSAQVAEGYLQIISVKKVSGDPIFAICYDGACSTPLTVDEVAVDALLVQNAITDLPTVSFNVFVTAATSDDFDASFNLFAIFEHGILSKFEIKVLSEPMDGLTSQVVVLPSGKPTLKSFILAMDGVPSGTIPKDPTDNEVETAIEEIFSVPCHPKLFEGKIYHYENDGSAVSDTEPFCGRFSLKNPGTILYYDDENRSKGPRISSASNTYMCVAYKGAGGVDYLTVRFTYEDANGDTEFSSIGVDVHNQFDGWKIACSNIYTLIRAKVTSDKIIVYQVSVRKLNNTPLDDLYIDHLMFVRAPPLVYEDEELLQRAILALRGKQAQPNGYFVDTVSVAKVDKHFQVTLKLHDCGFDIPLFGLHNSESSSNVHNLQGTNGNIQISVSSTQQSSPPITGSFKVKFKDEKIGSKIKITEELDNDNIMNNLKTVSTIGDTLVTSSGHCSDFSYKVKFLEQYGSQPLLEIENVELEGVDVSVTVTENVDGGLRFSPILGDSLRTHHSKPQTLVFVNKVPTKCASFTACDFEWTDGLTPTVTSISPETGSEGNSVTISGSGFGNVNADVKVFIGMAECTVTSASDSSVSCDLGNDKVGTAKVRLLVSGKGLAQGDVTFTYIFQDGGFSSSPGSIEGGTLITIPGKGIDYSNAKVYVGGKECVIKNASPAEIKCLTPRADEINAESTVDVELRQQTNTVVGQFTYNPNIEYTPVVTSLSTTQARAWGGEELTITGDGFTTTEGSVALGGKTLEVTTWTSTEIVVILPALPHGTYRLIVSVGTKGYADLRKNSIPDISYAFKVRGISRDTSSLYGGVDVVIAGVGFSTDDGVLSVSFGPHACDVKSITNSEIHCRVGDTGAYTVVKNDVESTLGWGYSWNKPLLDIYVGDYVTWEWQSPYNTDDRKYAVHQTTGANGVTKKSGFSSGERTSRGTFTHRFAKAGTYHYWSGYVDPDNVFSFRGVVNVLELQSFKEDLKIMQGGVEAVYEPGVNPPESLTCSPLSTPITGCVDDVTLTDTPDKFTMKFKKCISPVVDDISESKGSFDTEIEFTGKGFGTENCQNHVHYGDSSTVITSSSDSSVKFRVSAADEPAIGTLQQFSMHIVNVGYALIAVAGYKGFGLDPQVTSISPSKGSRVGGTEVKIIGSGFTAEKDFISLDFGSLLCDIMSVSYEEIVCETRCLQADSSPQACTASEKNLLLQFREANGVREVKCAEASTCTFTTKAELTPEITEISPDTVEADDTLLEISASGLGDSQADIKVLISGTTCEVQQLTNTGVTCLVDRLPVGENHVRLYVANQGFASSSKVVTSSSVAEIETPAASGIHGGAVLHITGNGFVADETVVMVDGQECEIVEVTLSYVKCKLPANSEGTVAVTVKSNGVDYEALELEYSSSLTPSVTSVTPNSGRSGTSVTIAGSGFNSPASSEPTVTIGDVDCAVTSASQSSITCTVGVLETGEFPVQVFVEQIGNSDTETSFTFEIGAFTLSPDTGSLDGGQLLTLTGSGFLADNTEVSLCDKICAEVSVSAGEYTCRTPKQDSGKTCNVVVKVRDTERQLDNAYTYAEMGGSLTSVSPTRAGSGGGTLITITGTGFGVEKSEVTVNIGKVECTIGTVDDTTITCTTGESTSGVYTVNVQVDNQGLAQQNDVMFEVVDLWSSPFTWGGLNPPTKGDFVVVKAGQLVVVDEDTAVLKMLLIQGGSVIFDDGKDIELQAENILITDGGLLQIGTEDKPHTSKAIITLHGHLRSPELPIYGSKTVAVRNGTLNLYGTPVTKTWTQLSTTAEKDATEITLKDAVEWKVGDEIVIATTGLRHSQQETEKRKITEVKNTGKTLVLDKALEFKHISVEQTWGTRTVEFAAEVGLLTRNIVVRGNVNIEWETQIAACPAGFDTGEFATQTCFQGRFGEEIGYDQYGSQIMVHQSEKDSQVAQAHIQYVEVTYAGQAFRLGRYAIHFHLNGNMDKSFVKGCGIHNTFNRAVNIHGSHNALVSDNVVYDIMGGALFLEDGDEVGNRFENNLVLFVRSSTSLRNDDITPAGFWVTNPSNYLSGNHVAGGTHFGFWYRMHKNPDGPGYDETICPQAYPVGEFRDNHVHSNGWFGLWIFEKYIPREDSSCSKTAAHAVQKFYSLTTWNCEKGAEGVDVGAVQFHDCVFVNNEKAGYEGKRILGLPPYMDSENGPGIFSSLIVAHVSALGGEPTVRGVVQPYNSGFLIKDVEFHGFNQKPKSAIGYTKIDGTCSTLCGGFLSAVENLKFIDSPFRVLFEWESHGILIDKDGSITNNAGYSIVPKTGSIDSSRCVENTDDIIGEIGYVCQPSVKLGRIAFGKIEPESLLYKGAKFTSQYGESITPFAEKRITIPDGWAFVLMRNEKYSLEFVDGEHLSNISFSAVFDGFDVGDKIMLTQHSEQRPDQLSLNGIAKDASLSPLSLSVNVHGDWYYDEDENTVEYIIGRQAGDATAFSVSMVQQRCFFRGCKRPDNPIDATDEPENSELWSLDSTWDGITDDNKVPKAGSDVYIEKFKWVKIDAPIPRLRTLTIDGGLLVANGLTEPIVLEADYIYINGLLAAGFKEKEPFEGDFTIRLRGTHESPVRETEGGPPLGTKAIGVYGKLTLIGKNYGIVKTKLASTVYPNENTLTLEEAVTWEVDQQIVVTTTDYHAGHSEVLTISEVNDKTITVKEAFQYKHIAHTETVNGEDISLTAYVGLLSRNVRIEGGDYDSSIQEPFGARVLVATGLADDGEYYSGTATIVNTEFFRTGQEGWVENYDARFSVAVIDGSATRQTKIESCAFHHGFSTAVGVFGTNDVIINNNVIYQVVHDGIRTEATNTQITNNLISMVYWPGGYQDREESFNLVWNAGVNGFHATDLKLDGNVVAGSERFGYHLNGQRLDTVDLWQNNMAVGCLIGYGMFPKPNSADDTLVVNGFTVWKNVDAGFYVQDTASVKYTNNRIVENGIGVFTLVVGPSALAHQVADKSVTIESNIFIGKTNSFSDSTDKLDNTIKYLKLHIEPRHKASLKSCGKIGLRFGLFSSGSNNAPKKPFFGEMSYNALNGITYVIGNTFVNFGSCTGGRDYAVEPSGSDDGSFPARFSDNQLINVDTESKAFFPRPNVKLIDPSNCVDMDCDGKKKNILEDLDGSFVGDGSPAVVLSDAAFEWEGDPRRGLGDYRIPKVMLTDVDGSRLDVETVAGKKGIFAVNESSTCEYVDAWQAYKCNNKYKYRILTIESLDADTEKRRLSPVAIHHVASGYVDLINGPQDHGWCAGYTCQKRISTFQAIVAADEPFVIYLSSTNPKRTQFRLVHANDGECVKLAIWYQVFNRLDLFLNDVFTAPTNYHTVDGKYKRKPVLNEEDFVPDVTDKNSGDNFMQRSNQLFHLVMCGSDVVMINQTDVFVVSYTVPDMSEDEFFGEKLVVNLARFLNLDPSKLRIVDIVSETSGTGRRKRQTTLQKFYVEISDEPGTENTVDLNQVAARVVDQTHLYSWDDILDVEVVYVSVQEPSEPGSEDGGEMTTIEKAGSLSLKYHPVGNVGETNLFSTQPQLVVLNDNDEVVNYLGAHSSPWQVEVSIKDGGENGAIILGTKIVTFVNGWANYTDLAINLEGSYTLEFQIISPAEASSYKIVSYAVKILPRQIGIKAVVDTATRLTDRPMELTISLVDKETDTEITDLTWAGHTSWSASIQIYSSEIYWGRLTGNSDQQLDSDSAEVSFPSLTLDEPGRCPLLVTITSEPAGYEVTTVAFLDLMTDNQFNIVVQDTRIIQLKYPIEYNTDTSSLYAAYVWNRFSKDNNTRVTDVETSKGSLIVSLTIEGTKDGLSSLIDNICDQIENSENYTFGEVTVPASPHLYVDGKKYYGEKCGPVDSDGDDDFDILYIILIVVGIFLVLLIIFFVVLYKCYILPRAKTFDVANNKTHEYSDTRHLNAFDSKEQSFFSLRMSGTSPMPPMTTNLDRSGTLTGTSKDPYHRPTRSPPLLVSPNLMEKLDAAHERNVRNAPSPDKLAQTTRIGTPEW